jgi:ketosteroid isomerase-like protein
MPADAGTPTMQRDKQQVWEVVEAFNHAFATGDVEGYFSYIDPEITVLTPANPYRIEGIADDREEFVWGLRAGTGRVGFFQELQPFIRISGNMALVTYYSRGSYGSEGAEKTLYLKETDVLIRRQQEWKILHIHVSAS